MTGVVAAVAVTLFVDLLAVLATRWGGRTVFSDNEKGEDHES
ncbi:MAG TPA: hypothetical protein PKI41_05705 [Candidatus Competibacteraceae bacterium]|nr:hypothetical protein [Candidatus Competibacteraceae bacterium]HQA25223.1 hypothetical protein [Candidatus Competibacteraceae bacterium]HQD56159.1 hypothetical protein [Candidatus Competibacteraceae bacterium]